jgi:hypothetical protein
VKRMLIESERNAESTISMESSSVQNFMRLAKRLERTWQCNEFSVN